MKVLLTALLLTSLLAGAALFGLWVAFDWPADGVQVIVNGHPFDPRELSATHAMTGGLALGIGLFVVVLVVPLVLLLAFALPLVLVLGAVALLLGALIGVGALATAPLLLPLLLAWWLLRRSRRPAPRAGGATIDA